MAEFSKDMATYKCPACGLHYRDQSVAFKCAAWCEKYKSCSLEITKLSVERTANI